jgi:AraC family transcriptional regulator
MTCLLLSDLHNNCYWEDGRQVSAFSLQAGQVTIHALKREPLAQMDKPLHSLLFYLPCAAFNALAAQSGAGESAVHGLPDVGARSSYRAKYGGMQTVARPLKGGLGPWQEKRSKEMMAGDLSGATSLREIAEACGLSVSHFSRAFGKSTGLA